MLEDRATQLLQRARERRGNIVRLVSQGELQDLLPVERVYVVSLAATMLSAEQRGDGVWLRKILKDDFKTTLEGLGPIAVDPPAHEEDTIPVWVHRRAGSADAQLAMELACATAHDAVEEALKEVRVIGGGGGRLSWNKDGDVPADNVVDFARAVARRERLVRRVAKEIGTFVEPDRN